MFQNVVLGFATLVAGLLCWSSTNKAFPVRELSAVEMKRIVGGVIPGPCNVYAILRPGSWICEEGTFRCDAVCDDCAQYNQMTQFDCETIGFQDCWKCGGSETLKECKALSKNGAACNELGSPSTPCGSVYNAGCQWNPMTKICSCKSQFTQLPITECYRHNCAQ